MTNFEDDQQNNIPEVDHTWAVRGTLGGIAVGLLVDLKDAVSEAANHSVESAPVEVVTLLAPLAVGCWAGWQIGRWIDRIRAN